MRETPKYIYPQNPRKRTFKIGEITTQEIDLANADQRRKAAAIENYKKYGSCGFYINMGTLDRIMAKEPNMDNLDEGSRIAYEYGYYQRGNRVLEESIKRGFIKYEYRENGLKKIYYIPKEEFEEMLKNIAINDSMNDVVNPLDLTDIIRGNDIYVENYLVGKICNSPQKRIKK